MATAALRHDKTLAEIASEHSISPVQAVKWKKQALEGLLSVFEDGRQKKAVSAEESALLDSNDLAQVNLIPLMWQTGYLTIRGYAEASRDYTLDFPNREARQAFFKTLANKFTGLKPSVVRSVAPKCRRHIEQRECAPFIGVMRTLFARIPNTLLKHESESSYHVAFLMILEAMEMKIHAELPTKIGRIDLVVEMQNCIYIVELKFNKGPKTALEQIERKNYKQRYTTEGKDLILVRINFSSKSRNISDCKAITYFKDGSKSPEIDIPVQS